MTSTRWGLGIALLVLLAPLAAAAAPARVTLEDVKGAWNGRSEAGVENGTALAWVPAGARVHDVRVLDAGGANASAATWRAEGPDAVLVTAGPGAATAIVDFDFAASTLTLARYVAPTDVAPLAITVIAPTDQRVDSADASFADRGNGTFAYSTPSLASGQSVTIRVVDADRVGELPLLAAVAIVAAVVFVGALAWHRVRPPAPRGGATRFLDHLVELQARLVPPILAFAFLNVFFFVAGLRVAHVAGAPLVVPQLSDRGSLAARAFDAFAERQVPAGVTLVVLRPIDAVLAEVQVALFLAFVAVLPLLLYELVAFIGPALREKERKLALRIIPLILALFLVGATFGYVTMSPLMIRTLYDFAPAVGASSFLAVGDLVSFALIVVLSFGLAFELPVVMYALSRFGLVKAKTWWKYVRHAIVLIFLIAGIITPDPSVVSQTLVAVPVTGLYLLGAAAAAWGERRRARAAGTASATTVG